MANVNVHGLNFEDGNSLLLAIYGNDIAVYTSGSDAWVGQSQNLIPGNFSVARMNKYGYIYSLTDVPRTVTSSGTFSYTTNLTNSPKAAQAYGLGNRVYIGDCKIGSDSYQRRVFFTDIIEDDDNVKWGLEYGTDLAQTASSAVVTSATGQFKTVNIKIGDTLVIQGGPNAGTYAVDTVDSETQITLTRSLPYNSSGDSYLVGGNWFDLDNQATGLGEHYGTLLAFEYSRAWRWSPAIGKKPIIGVHGTSSAKSIVQHRGYTFWFHPTDGIIQFNGSTGRIISQKIQEVIDGMSSANYGSVVGWPGVGKYKDHVYFYLGDVTIDDVDNNSETISDCVADFNIARSTVKIHSLHAAIVSATVFVENNQEVVYAGTDSDVVLKLNNGSTDYDVATDDDSTTLDISWYMETHPFYPSGIEVMNQFHNIFCYMDRGTTLNSQYRLCGTPNDDDSSWQDVIQINQKYDQKPIDRQKSMARGFALKHRKMSSTTELQYLGHSVIYEPKSEAYEDEL